MYDLIVCLLCMRLKSPLFKVHNYCILSTSYIDQRIILYLGIYRGVTTTNTSTTSGLVNLYSPTHSSVGTSIVGGGGSLASGLGAAIASTSQDNTQTYIVHHHHHNSGTNPPGSPDSSNAAPEHYQLGGMGASSSLVTTPLDIEWSSTTQYLQKPQQAIMTSSGHQLHHQQPLNLLSNHIIAATTDNRIHYTVHQTQNRLAVALTGSMNRLSDHRGSTGSPCPNPASSSSYPVNIPLTSPDIGYNYPRQIFSRGLSPPPQYSRAESPPYYPSYGGDSGGGIMGDSFQQQQHHNYLSRTSTLPLSLARKPPSGASGNRTPLVTSPLGSSYMSTSQQPKSILRTSENFRRVVTNETPPPIPPHNTNSSFTFGGGGSMEGGIGSIAYRSVDSRTNLSSQPLLILESSVDSSANKDVQVPPPLATSGGGPDEEEDDDDGEDSGLHTATLIRRPSISAGVSASSGGNDEEEDEERRDQFDIHDIDSDAFSRLLEIDCDSKL